MDDDQIDDPGSSERDDPRPAETFGADLRLRQRHEFRVVQSKGRRVHTRHFVLLVHAALPRRPESTACPPSRIGITVTKKVGNAVERNRVKRRVREVFRRNRDLFPDGVEIVFIAKRGSPEVPYEVILGEIRRVRRALGKAAQTAKR